MTLEPSDIHSLSNLQRSTKERLREMERTGNPRVLTVSGKARVVVQDARSYQRLLRKVEEADPILTQRNRLASLRRGKKGRDLFEVLEELGERVPAPRPRRR